MSRIVQQTVIWWPVIIRLVLWCAISCFTVALGQLKDVTIDRLAAMTWLDWTKIILEVVLAVSITARTFLDQTLARHSGLLEGRDRK